MIVHMEVQDNTMLDHKLVVFDALYNLDIYNNHEQRKNLTSVLVEQN